MGIILLFKNPKDELKYLEFKRRERVKRIHLIKKLLTCLKEEDFEKSEYELSLISENIITAFDDKTEIKL